MWIGNHQDWICKEKKALSTPHFPLPSWHTESLTKCGPILGNWEVIFHWETNFHQTPRRFFPFAIAVVQNGHKTSWWQTPYQQFRDFPNWGFWKLWAIVLNKAHGCDQPSTVSPATGLILNQLELQDSCACILSPRPQVWNQQFLKITTAIPNCLNTHPCTCT